MNEARRLSPFLMVDLIEKYVALMQQEHKDLLNAPILSTTEVKATRTKLIASTPTESEVLIMTLNRFANLLFVFFLVLPIVQASLHDYQGAKRIIAERKCGTSSQHQDYYPVDSPHTNAEICTRKNYLYTRMPWGVYKYIEPTHRKKM